MNLDEAQRKRVADWITEGLKLSDIQNRLATELGVRLTYMEVRLLVDDLKLIPKDPEPAKPSEGLVQPTSTAAPDKPASKLAATQPAQAQTAGGSVSVSVDQLTRPGAIISGKVTFSDGQTANWYIDQTGRVGLATQQAGYRPSAADLQQFQVALDSEMRRMGL
jgi:hypothetical protein